MYLHGDPTIWKALKGNGQKCYNSVFLRPNFPCSTLFVQLSSFVSVKRVKKVRFYRTLLSQDFEVLYISPYLLHKIQILFHAFTEPIGKRCTYDSVCDNSRPDFRLQMQRPGNTFYSKMQKVNYLALGCSSCVRWVPDFLKTGCIWGSW